ncbi:STAS domain-containing protein [Jannaschia faecimaris]|uniref:STAS domain-containing protein n=1 Tax=Jannaschia faecimaris TaxID=1244108 RepID=A0A1H3TB68_9RHOB|nr:STAS domain-containing protein [Jannaschia faecimaris]SDZ46569.1 STAS domain-containing protein [Jannaschia faecimaris]
MTALTESDGVIVLPERVDISAADALRDLVLADTRDLTFDAGTVALVTTPGLQVMMAARDHQKARNKTMRIVAPSTGFCACLQTLGVPIERLQTGEGSA